MTTQSDILSSQVYSLLESGLGRQEIEMQLVEKGHEESFVKEVVGEAVSQRYAKRRSQGLNLVLSGALICFLSFLLTITSSFSHLSFPYVLYGLTSVGITVAFAGFMKVF